MSQDARELMALVIMAQGHPRPNLDGLHPDAIKEIDEWLLRKKANLAAVVKEIAASISEAGHSCPKGYVGCHAEDHSRVMAALGKDA